MMASLPLLAASVYHTLTAPVRSSNFPTVEILSLRNENARNHPGKPVRRLLVLPMSETNPDTSAGEQDKPQSPELLLPIVYDQLRRLAAQKLAQEAPGHT